MLQVFQTKIGRHVAKVALVTHLFQILYAPLASAVDEGVNQAKSTLTSYSEAQIIQGAESWLNQYGNSRIKTHYDFDAERFDDSSIDMLFALKDNKTDVTFTQFGYRHYDDRNTVNIGLGYRALDDTYLWGANAFYDRDLTGKNDRVSLGAEYFRDYLRVNANSYFGLTNWHDSDEVWHEGNDIISLQEKPADGVDITLNGYLPDYPQLGLKLGYEQYFGNNVNLFGDENLTQDPYAFTLGLHHTPVPLLTWGIDHKQGKSGEHDTRAYIGLNYRFGETLENQTNSDNVNSLRTFNVGRLDLVERSNIITLDYRRNALQNEVLATPVADGLTLTVIRNNALANDIATNEVEAIVLDKNGKPIEGEVVIFKDAQGNQIGLATTDKNGIAKLDNLRSTTPGEQIIIAELSSNPAIKNQIPVNFVDNAIVENASLTLKSIQDFAVANNMDSNVVEAILLDKDGLPVANVNINFYDDAGNLLTTSVTNEKGIATGILHSGVAGTINVVAKIATTELASAVKSNSVPSTFVPAATAQNAASIMINTVSDGALANGVAFNTVQATVLDANNNPVVGLEVEFVDSNNKVVGKGFTSKDGTVRVNIPSSIVGTMPITARVVGNTTIKSTTDIHFVDEQTLQGGSIQLVPGTNNSPSDGLTENSVEATVLDKNNNPVINIQVDFIDKKTGEVIGTGTTDNNGKVIGKITSDIPGDIEVIAIIPGSNPPITSAPVIVTFINTPTINNTAIIDLAVLTPNGVVADGKAVNTLQATVRDQNGNMLPAIEVEFVDAAGNVLSTDTPLITDAKGQVKFDMTSLKAGEQPVTVRVKNNPTIISAPVNVIFTDTTRIDLAVLTPNGVLADGKSVNTLQATLRDQNGNLLPAIEVEFVDAAGNVLSTNTPLITDAKGQVKFDMTSLKAGEQPVTVRVKSNPTISSAPVKVIFTDTTIIDLAVLTPNGVLADGKAINTLQATVRDQNGNLLPAIEVEFVDATGNVLSTNTPLITDASGQVKFDMTSLKAGKQPVTVRVKNNPAISSAPVNVIFTEAATIDLAVLTPEGVVADGKAVNTLQATVRDQNGNILPAIEVEFVDAAGNVLSTNTPLITDASGQVKFDMTSLKAGEQPVTVRVKNNPNLNQTKPVIFKADETTAKIASVTPTTPKLVANGQETTPIEILVTDANGNILVDYPLESITDNAGNTYTGPFKTDGSGKVILPSFPSQKPGTVTVTANLANGSTGNGDIVFSQYLEEAKITIEPEKAVVIADGKDTTIAFGILTDKFGNPIAGQEIRVSIDGVTDPIITSTGPDGKYQVPVPASNTVGAEVKITATTVNLTTQVTAETSVLYNGDIATKTLAFDVEKDTLIANSTNSSNMTVTVKDVNGIPIINQEVTIFDNESGQTYEGITDASGQFVYNYIPYDSTGVKRFVPGTDVIFEAGFKNNSQGVKTDQLRLTHGVIQISASDQMASVVVGIPLELPFILTQRQNNIDLTIGQFFIDLQYPDTFTLQKGVDYTIEVSNIAKKDVFNGVDRFESIAKITFLNTPASTNFLSSVEDFQVISERWTSSQIDPNSYTVSGNIKNININL